MSAKPATNPMTGASTMNSRVSFHFFPQRMAAVPAFAIADPAYAPMSACEELDGMP